MTRHPVRRSSASLTTAVALFSAGFVALAPPASADPVLGASFNPAELGSMVGVGFDDVSGNVFVYGEFSANIHEYTPAGALVDFYAIAPDCTSNDMDLDFAPEQVNLGGTQAPKNSLLVSQGECTQSLRAENKNNGTDLTGQVTLQAGQVLVGGSWAAARNAHFAVTWGDDVIREYSVAASPATVLNSFTVHPAGFPAFDVFFGDVEVSLTTGNLYVVSSSQNRIRELTPTGTFVQDVDLGPLGVTGMSGIAIDDATGAIWLSSTNGTVYRIDGVLPPAPTLSIGNKSVVESAPNAKFQVRLSAPTAQTVTVDYETADGTAEAGSDYTATAGTVTFPPGTTTKTVTVPVLEDTIDEPAQRFTVSLSDSRFVEISDGTGTGTITDNDAEPALRIADANVDEGDSGTSTMKVRVRLDQPSEWVVNVDYATADGTATAPADYLAANGTIRFRPGQIVRVVKVTVNGDVDVEGNEYFSVLLSNPSRATIADGTGKGRIINDD